MARFISPNLRTLVTAYTSGKRGAVLEGSSRSMKTWSGIDFLILLCSRFVTNEKIIITRETFNSFKTTLYDDFNRRLPMFGLPSPTASTDNVTKFKLFSNTIHLLGADDPNKFEGAGSGFFWMNEVLDQPNAIFDQLEQRCRIFFWMDYNPKTTHHWVYDKVCNRPDVMFCKSTFLDNPFISPQERNKILSYEPTAQNIANGTADEFRWNVYGLGLRTSHEGLVFKTIYEYTDLPTDCNLYKLWAVDWGGNDPTTLTEINIDGDNNRLYIKEHIYTPQILNSELIRYIVTHNSDNKFVICDSARKDKIFELQNAGINAMGCTKGEGSISDGIDRMKEFRIFVHSGSSNARNEFGSYKWAIDKASGKPLNEPEDANNHIIDGVRYAVRFYKRNIKP